MTPLHDNPEGSQSGQKRGLDGRILEDPASTSASPGSPGTGPEPGPGPRPGPSLALFRDLETAELRTFPIDPGERFPEDAGKVVETARKVAELRSSLSTPHEFAGIISLETGEVLLTPGGLGRLICTWIQEDQAKESQ